MTARNLLQLISFSQSRMHKKIYWQCRSESAQFIGILSCFQKNCHHSHSDCSL